MDVLLIEAREALLQRRNSLSARAREGMAVEGESHTENEPLTESEQQELLDIDRALARMEDGEFGRCARCGGAIGRHRLRAIPEARYCMTCSDAVGR